MQSPVPQSPVPSTPSATTPSATTPSSSTPVPRSRRLHPLVGAAAVAVVVASLTAVAAMTGVLPTSKANQNANMEAAPTATPSATAPVAGYVPQTPPPGSTTRPPAYEQASNNAPPQPAAQQPAPAVKPSHTAGRIVAVTPIQTEKPTSGLGAVGGAVVGGLLGNQIGRGNGRILGTVAGAAAGGYAGNVVEKHVNKDTQYRVSVKMDDGTQRTFTYERDPGVQIGQRVHMERGVLVNG